MPEQTTLTLLFLMRRALARQQTLAAFVYAVYGSLFDAVSRRQSNEQWTIWLREFVNDRVCVTIRE